MDRNDYYGGESASLNLSQVMVMRSPWQLFSVFVLSWPKKKKKVRVRGVAGWQGGMGIPNALSQCPRSQAASQKKVQFQLNGAQLAYSIAHA